MEKFREEDQVLLEDILKRNYLQSLQKFGDKNLTILIDQDNIINCQLEKMKNPEKAIFLDNIETNLNKVFELYKSYKLYSNIVFVSVNEKNAEIIKKCITENFTENFEPYFSFLLDDDNIDIITSLRELNYKLYFNIIDDNFGNKNNLQSYLNLIKENIEFRVKFLITSKNVDKLKNFYDDVLNLDKLKNNVYFEESDLEWDQKSIISYLNFLDETFDSYIEAKDESGRFRHLVRNKREKDIYDIISLTNHSVDLRYDCIKCPFQNSLTVKLSNLSIIPCLGIYQQEFKIAEYHNEKIENKNVSMLVAKDHIKRSACIHCESCSFLPICKGFCFSTSYNKYNDLFVPNRTYCSMQFLKYKFLLKKYIDTGLETFLDDTNCNTDFYFKNYLNKLIEAFEKGDIHEG